MHFMLVLLRWVSDPYGVWRVGGIEVGQNPLLQRSCQILEEEGMTIQGRLTHQQGNIAAEKA